MRRIFIVTLLVLLFIGSMSFTDKPILTDAAAPTSNREFSSSQWIPDEPLTDPYLESEPSVIVNGTSGEFSSSYYAGSGGLTSYVNLTWTHVAGTELSFKGSSSDFPYSNDFIYLSLPFQCESPWEAAVSVDVRLETTGDFSEYEEFPMMYDLFTAVIDPSDTVVRIFQIWPSTNEFAEYGQKLGWDSVSVLSLNPSTTIELVVGLNPSRYFEDHYNGSTIYPWTFYNGSVTLSVRAVHLGAFIDGYDSENIPPFPPLIGAWQGGPLTAHGDDVVVAPDGYVYTLGTEGSYGDQEAHLVLVKWDSYARSLWSRRIDTVSVTGGIALAIPGDGYIYALGSYRPDWLSTELSEFRLAKWDYNGNLIWHRTVDSILDYATDMAVDGDGTIYIIGYEGSHDNGTAILVKCDSECVHQWTIDWMERPSYPSDIVVDSEGNFYVAGYESFYDSYLAKWDSEGNQLWNLTRTLSMLDMGADGYLYAAARHDDGIIATKMDLSGTEVWNATWARLYHSARLYFTPPTGVAASPDGSVYVVAEGFLPHSVPLIVKFDENGIYQWNRTWSIGHIGEGTWVFYGNYRKTVDVGENGLAYVTGYISTETNGYIGLAVFGDSVPSTPFDLLTIGVLGVGGVGVAVALVIVYRKRKTQT